MSSKMNMSQAKALKGKRRRKKKQGKGSPLKLDAGTPGSSSMDAADTFDMDDSETGSVQSIDTGANAVLPASGERASQDEAFEIGSESSSVQGDDDAEAGGSTYGRGNRLAGEVGRCILSASMGSEAGVMATLKHFKPPKRKIGSTDKQVAQELALQRQNVVSALREEMNVFIRMADVKLLRAKLHQQRSQNKKLMARNRVLRQAAMGAIASGKEVSQMGGSVGGRIGSIVGMRASAAKDPSADEAFEIGSESAYSDTGSEQYVTDDLDSTADSLDDSVISAPSELDTENDALYEHEELEENCSLGNPLGGGLGKAGLTVAALGAAGLGAAALGEAGLREARLEEVLAASSPAEAMSKGIGGAKLDRVKKKATANSSGGGGGMSGSGGGGGHCGSSGNIGGSGGDSSGGGGGGGGSGSGGVCSSGAGPEGAAGAAGGVMLDGAGLELASPNRSADGDTGAEKCGSSGQGIAGQSGSGSHGSNTTTSTTSHSHSHNHSSHNHSGSNYSSSSHGSSILGGNDPGAEGQRASRPRSGSGELSANVNATIMDRLLHQASQVLTSENGKGKSKADGRSGKADGRSGKADGRGKKLHQDHIKYLGKAASQVLTSDNGKGKSKADGRSGKAILARLTGSVAGAQALSEE
jgi:hypothetical protein